MTSADDEIRAVLYAWRELGEDVPSTLVSRGWMCVNPEAGDGETVEWLWPPTAPVGYGGQPEWRDPGVCVRPQMYAPRFSPWTAPTRLLQHPDSGWQLEYGAALAQEPEESRGYADTAELLADLERIESWPMSLEEWRREAMGRLWRTTIAAAENGRCVATPITEPYGSRWDAIYQRRMIRDDARIDDADSSDLVVGNLSAQWRLVDAEAWASAVRTARACGPGWRVNGPDGERWLGSATAS